MGIYGNSCDLLAIKLLEIEAFLDVFDAVHDWKSWGFGPHCSPEPWNHGFYRGIIPKWHNYSG